MATPATPARATSDPHPASAYRAAAGVVVPDLTEVPGVRTVVDEPGGIVEIERHDSPDLRLAASGIVLALHRTEPPGAAGEAVWRLHLPDAHDEEQLQVPAAPPDVEGVAPEVPGELQELVRGALRGASLRPVGRIRRVRTRLRLRDGRGREVAEVIRDEVGLATFGASTTVENWTETSPHAGATAPAGLERALHEQLAAVAAPVTTSAEAELDRMLRVQNPLPPRAAGKKKSAGAVVLAYLGAQADRLAEQDVQARRDAPDGVHQMRVAARRMRSALQAFHRLFDGPRTDELITELRWLGQALSPARDLEVLEKRITAGLDALADELVLGPVRAGVTRYFARNRAEAHAAMLTDLDGERYAALRLAIERFLQDPPLSARADRKAAKELKAHLRRTRKRFDRRMAAAIDAVAAAERDPAAGRVGTVTDADLAVHAARKAGKRLRYATEVVRGRKDAKAKRLKAVQTALGEHQDAVVARATLRELGAQGAVEGENGFTFGVLYGRTVADAERIKAQLRTL